VLLNPFNHLPDAVETTQAFHDFWYFWGDVRQRIYFDNWKLIEGITFPTNLVEGAHGVVWSSSQALNVEFNVQMDEKAFEIERRSRRAKCSFSAWNRRFAVKQATTCARDRSLCRVLERDRREAARRNRDFEAPISALYTEGSQGGAASAIGHADQRGSVDVRFLAAYPAVYAQAVALGSAVYVLDLNQPLLDKMWARPHTMEPDAYAEIEDFKTPHWKIVAKKQEIGSGTNRMELYPLRGASTERHTWCIFRSTIFYTQATRWH